MDAQSLINLLFSACGALGGFILKATWDTLKDMRKEMAALQASIHDNYVRRDDFKMHASRIEMLLDKIAEKIDAKADKPWHK